MILTAHQPVYLPWIGLLNKIAKADLFCHFDIVQYQKKDFNNRNSIKTKDGILLLSVPVESKNHFEKSVGKINIINKGWDKKHIKSIKLSYSKADFFKKYFEELEFIIAGKKYKTLSELNLKILKFLLKSFNINTPIVLASDYNFEGKKSDLVLDMCLKLKAKKYIFGQEGKKYANKESFIKKGISVYFQKFVHPTYKQLHGKFIPKLSAIDLLFNEGPKSKNIILKDNENLE